MNTNLGKKSTETSGWKLEQKKNDVDHGVLFSLVTLLHAASRKDDVH